MSRSLAYLKSRYRRESERKILRDNFAMAALSSMPSFGIDDKSYAAERCYSIADAMLKARDKK